MRSTKKHKESDGMFWSTYAPWFIGVIVVTAGAFWRLDHAQIVAFYKAHTTAKEREIIATDLPIVRTLAQGAVVYVEEFIQGTGAEKFLAAVERVITILGKYGYTPNPDLVRQEVQYAYKDAKANNLLEKAPAK